MNSYIADLGLCQPANHQKEEGKIFGVLPYVAPEVLQSQPYTQASDIYSFGIIAHELLVNSYPYADKNLDDNGLALEICQGLRPDIDKLKIPQLLKDLIKKCWDANPTQRPTAEELTLIFDSWTHRRDSEFDRQSEEIEEEYDDFSENTPYRKHPSAITHSKLINTKEITNLLKSPLVINEQSSDLEELIEIETVGQNSLEDDFGLNELNLEDYETETIAQQEIPSKK